MGVGVFDILFEDEQTKRKVIAINNARRSYERDKNKKKGRKTTLMKEDLYNNLKNLMENGKIKLFDDPRLEQSLRSIQYDYGDGGSLRIHGIYTHIAEALIRAAWCTKDKSLNICVV